MPVADYEDLIVPALSALASSPGGTMTLTQFIALLETRQGSTEESASDAQSPESCTFEQRVRAMVLGGNPGNLLDRGFVAVEDDATTISVTPAGKAFVGRH